MYIIKMPLCMKDRKNAGADQPTRNQVKLSK